MLGALDCTTNVTGNHKAYHNSYIFSPCLGCILKKIKQFAGGGGALGKIKLAPHLQPHLFLPQHKEANSTRDKRINSELKVQTSNNSQSTVCVPGKPQSSDLGPAQIAWADISI